MDVQEEFKREFREGSWAKKTFLIIIAIVFGIVCVFLQLCAKLFHITYETVNVVAYYFLIPLSWASLLDRYLQLPYTLSIFYIGIWIGIVLMNWGRFQSWCDTVFMKSVDFLLWFKRVKWNYHVASVILCVVIPFAIYFVLLWLNRK